MEKNENSPISSDGSSALIAVDLFHPNDVRGFSDWDIDFRQIEPGPLKTSVLARSGSAVSVLEMSMDRAVHQVGQSPRDAATFAIASCSNLSTWRGREVKGNPLLDFGQGGAFDAFSTDGFSGLTLSVEIGALVRVSNQTGLPLPSELPGAASQITDEGGPETEALGSIARRAIEDAGGDFSLRFQEELIAHILAAASASENLKDRVAPRAREGALRRALEVMNACAEDDLSICEICAEASTSWRSLNRVFKERFGVGPKAYYQCLRLTRVRSQLQTCDRDTLVSDVAHAWGFYRMGDFARAYSHLFGELPSQTIGRRKSRSACSTAT